MVTDHEWNLFLYAHFTDIELSDLASSLPLVSAPKNDHNNGVMG